MQTMGTLQTAEDYREQAKYHAGQADAHSRTLELFNNELPQQLKTWLMGERQHERNQEVKCYELAITILKGDK